MFFFLLLENRNNTVAALNYLLIDFTAPLMSITFKIRHKAPYSQETV